MAVSVSSPIAEVISGPITFQNRLEEFKFHFDWALKIAAPEIYSHYEQADNGLQLLIIARALQQLDGSEVRAIIRQGDFKAVFDLLRAEGLKFAEPNLSGEEASLVHHLGCYLCDLVEGCEGDVEVEVRYEE